MDALVVVFLDENDLLNKAIGRSTQGHEDELTPSTISTDEQSPASETSAAHLLSMFATCVLVQSGLLQA